MPETKRKITRDDILASGEYDQQRKSLKANLIPMKKLRRIEVGPFATFYFENYATMWLQVQEMLRIEKGGEEQIPGELAAYNPLIPQGAELVATVMFEIDDPVRRARVLGGLGGIEHKAFIKVGDALIRSVAEDDQERSRADGKASSVQFLRFPFTAAQIAAFKGGKDDVVAGFDHPNYGHMAVIPPAVRAALAQDFA